MKNAFINPALNTKNDKKEEIIEDLYHQKITKLSQIIAITGFKKTFIRKILARLSKYGTNITLKRGFQTKITPEMIHFIERILINNAGISFKKAYQEMLDHFNLDKKYIGE